LIAETRSYTILVMATTKKPSTPKKKKTTTTAAKKASPKTKAAPKKVVKKSPVTAQKVDYYPNRMTLAVSVLAGTLLVLVTLIAVLGVQ